MAITISGGGGVGITIESDPTAVKLVGSTMSGELALPQLGNVLNTNLVIDSYNDTGSGTHYYHTFTPFDGKFNLAPNGGGLTFPNGTVQTTAGLPLTGGTVTGKVNFTPVAGVAGINVGIGGTSAAATVAGDMWIATGGNWMNFRDASGVVRTTANINSANNFIVPQVIQTPIGTVNAALRVTQLGTGDAFRVEDENPESTPFVINQFGRVGIGTAPDGSACLKVDNTGIRFADGSTQTIGFTTSSQQALADSIWLAHNFRNCSLSASFDSLSGRTTIQYNHPVAEALINTYNSDIEIVHTGNGYPILLMGTGFLEFNGDLTGQPLLLRMRGITLTGGEFTL
jgi:hypothetical protein